MANINYILAIIVLYSGLLMVSTGCESSADTGYGSEGNYPSTRIPSPRPHDNKEQ